MQYMSTQNGLFDYRNLRYNAAMKIADRIKQERKARKWSQAELAHRCGWEHQSRISNYEQGRGRGREPDQEAIATLAKAFGMTIAEFLAPVGMTAGEPETIYRPSFGTGSQIHGEVALISSEEAAKLVELYQLPPKQGREMIATTSKVGPRAFALRIEDDSMTSPAGDSIPEGHYAIVDPDVDFRNGSIVVARLKGKSEVVIRRLVVDGPNKYLRTLNPSYKPIAIDDSCNIIGVVVQTGRDWV